MKNQNQKSIAMKNLIKQFYIGIVRRLLPPFGRVGVGFLVCWLPLLRGVGVCFFILAGLGGASAQNIGINGTGAAPDASALLDVDAAPGNNKGLLLPRLSTVERNAIVAPAQSLLIYNTTDSCYQGYIGTQWVSFGCVGSSTPPPPFTCGSSFTDARDGNVYNTVQIGSQCWMAENLAYLPSVVGMATGSTSVPYYYVYGYNGTSVPTAKATANYTTYGVLYNWPAAMNGAASSSSSPSGVQGVCPAGWHLPSDAEWCMMENVVEAGTDPGCSIAGLRGTNTGGNLKQTGTTLWTTPNTGATNSSGFTALPGGHRSNSSSFSDIGSVGYWWNATESSGTNAFLRNLFSSNAQVGRFSVDKSRGYSCRCVKD